MKRLAKINAVFEAKTGTHSVTGEPWVMQDIEIEWEENEPNTQPYKSMLVVTLNKKMKKESADLLVSRGTLIPVSFFFNTHEYNNKKYNSIRAFVPPEYLE